MAPRIQPTDEQLHAAWLQRRRPGWPHTLASVLAMPMLAAIVRAQAVRTVVAQRRPATPAPTQAQRTAPTLPAAHRQQHHVDLKRAAAGDRDD